MMLQKSHGSIHLQIFILKDIFTYILSLVFQCIIDTYSNSLTQIVFTSHCLDCVYITLLEDSSISSRIIISFPCFYNTTHATPLTTESLLTQNLPPKIYVSSQNVVVDSRLHGLTTSIIPQRIKVKQEENERHWWLFWLNSLWTLQRFQTSLPVVR
jgi:hypothetical protein